MCPSFSCHYLISVFVLPWLLLIFRGRVIGPILCSDSVVELRWRAVYELQALSMGSIIVCSTIAYGDMVGCENEK
jgi:hypothetical protein